MRATSSEEGKDTSILSTAINETDIGNRTRAAFNGTPILMGIEPNPSPLRERATTTLYQLQALQLRVERRLIGSEPIVLPLHYRRMIIDFQASF